MYFHHHVSLKTNFYPRLQFDKHYRHTSVGLNEYDLINIDFSKIEKNKFFYDVIYNPKSTKFLSNAKKLGHEIENGKMMFIYQACAAFEKWHNIRPQIDTKTVELLD